MPMGTHKRQRLAAAMLGATLWAALPAAGLAADNVVFVSGAFRRSIAVDDLEYLANTGQARGLLVDVLALAKQQPAEVGKLLKQELSLPLVLTTRLLGTRIGEAILARLAKIVYPLKASQVGIPALKAGVINGLAQGNGSLSAIGFLKAYPTGEMEVSIPALLAVMQKASSISELVKFFSESPLDGLRGEPAKAAP
ncbi:MAG: alpha/beta hydrolase [Synechococcaceae bacterium WB8_1B_136]|nr:alpha/beta hydrolase [Synechococcaceae bacterium WB8_1B_136]